MKSTLSKYIVIICMIFNTQLAFAEEIDEKFVGGEVSFDLVDDGEVDNENEMSFKQKIELLYEAGNYFEKNYPGDKIDGDILEDVEKFFPNSSSQEVFKRGEQIKSGVKLYRTGLAIVNYVKEKFIAPEEPPLIFGDKEYDVSEKYEYIEAPDGEVAVITDIKKVVSYSGDRRDIRATDAKKKRDLEKKERKSNVEKLYTVFSKIKFKDLLFGSTGYSPFTGDMGVGFWYKTEKVKVRMLSDSSNIDDKTKVRFIFDFVVEPGYFIKYSSLRKNKYIRVDLSESKNYKSSEIFYPAPYLIDFSNGDFDAGYVGDFAIPFVVEVEDIDMDLELEPDMYVTICDGKNICENINLKPFLILQYGEGMSSISSNYITKSFNNLPLSKDEKLIIEKVYAETIDGKKFLTIDFKNKYSIKTFEVFVESAENIDFYKSQSLIDGSEITSRLQQKDQSIDIINKPFSITASVNNIYSIRENCFVKDKSLLDDLDKKIPIKIIIFSILAGILMNFMPAVLPITLSRFISFSNFGGRDSNIIRRSLSLNVLGMLVGFVVFTLISILFNDYIYWGVQFENPFFITTSSFFMILMIAVFSDVIKIKGFDIFRFSNNKALNFFLGVLAVILSSTFAAPYLASSIGFSLAGNYMEMILVFALIFIGFTLPYLVFIISPHIVSILPQMGIWVKKMNKICLYALIFLLAWFWLIYFMKVDIWSTFRYTIYIILFSFFTYSIHIAMEEIDLKVSEIGLRKRLVVKYKKIFAVLLIIVFSTAAYDSYFSFKKASAEEMVRVPRIERSDIKEYIKEDKIVVVNFDANWCLMCKYNNVFVFNNIIVQERMRAENAIFINIDYSKNHEKASNFMLGYGRSSLPFTIIYSKQFPEGIILSKFLTETEMSKVLNNIKM